MTPAASYRGQPLVVLVLLLGGWATARTIVLESEVGRPTLAKPIALAGVRNEPVPSPQFAAPLQPALQTEAVIPYAVPAPLPPLQHFQPYSTPMQPLRPAMRSSPMPRGTIAPEPTEAVPLPGPVPVQVSAGHQLLWMAALSRMPLPPALLARPAVSSPVPGATPPQVSDRDLRWSADGWLLLRRGGTVSPAGGLAPATYGASQFGAVVRYRLAPQSPHRPALYLRGSAALNGSREREAALGLSVRPVAGLPVALAAEARVNDQPSGTRVRPAAFAYTEMSPFELPLGARAEFYGQAGYVGGNFASAFVDGQVRVDRRVLHLGRGELRAGGGAWGGAQKGASRLDVGPSATLGMPLGGSAGLRVAADWRFRVAGNAVPSSGPALTLSAGF